MGVSTEFMSSILALKDNWKCKMRTTMFEI